MKTKKILALLGCVLISTGLLGCTSVSDKDVANNQVQSEAVEVASSPDIKNDVKKLYYEEFETVEELTLDKLTSIFGNPSCSHKKNSLTEYTFKNGVEAVFNNKTNGLYQLRIENNDISHIRDIKIGDTFESVIERFESTDNNMYTLYADENESYEYKVLYGSATTLLAISKDKESGYINFVNEVPESIIYNSFGYKLKLEIKNNVVSAIEYELPYNNK